MNIRLLFILTLVASASGCMLSPDYTLTAAQRESVRVVTPQDVMYIPLNPARGDKAPQAGMLWGDIRRGSAWNQVGTSHQWNAYPTRLPANQRRSVSFT
ncbi:MAG: hypothetical protein AAGI88_19700 [Pseudomonadota bacterium]